MRNLEETPIGLLPADWNVVPFKTVREWLQYGTSIRCSLELSGHPVLRIPNVVDGRIDERELKYANVTDTERDNFALAEGDLVFIRTNGVLERVGSCAVYLGSPRRALFASYLIRARLRCETVEPEFVRLYATTHAGSSFLAGRAHPAADGKFNINTQVIDDMLIPVPPRQEQRAIVSVLRRVEGLVQMQDAMLLKLGALKHTSMHSLFTIGLRGDVQKETEIGPVPESWKRIPISALGQIVTGTTPATKDASSYVNGHIPFVAPGDIEHGMRIERTEKTITERGLSLSRPISAGTTCFVCIGSTIGKIGLSTADVCSTNQQINSIIPSVDYDKGYVFYLMAYWSAHVRKQASPSPVPILSKGAFEQIEIYTSRDIQEQRDVVAILETIDRKIDLHKRKRAVLDDLFKALLHKLMAGEIRVADLDLSALELDAAREAAA